MIGVLRVEACGRIGVEPSKILCRSGTNTGIWFVEAHLSFQAHDLKRLS